MKFLNMNLRRAFSGFAEFSCHYADNGRLHYWGNNRYYQCSPVYDTEINTPTPVEGLRAPGEDPIEPEDFSCGQHHLLLLTRGGHVLAWGINSAGQLGLGHTATMKSPQLVAIPGAPKIKRVKCGANFSMAITEEGCVFAWGSNEKGQLGLGHRQTPVARPTKVPGLPPVRDLGCGWCHALALTRTGEVWGWGYNEEGEVGHSDLQTLLSPTKTPLKGIVKLFSGSYHAFGLTASGTLLGWGWNTFGQLGFKGEAASVPLPVPFEGVVDVACGGSFTLALTRGGDLYSWGKNPNGQLGIPGQLQRLSQPRKIIFPGEEGSQKIVGFGALCEHSFALMDDGRMFCWGNRKDGRLGTGAGASCPTPTLLPEFKFRVPESFVREFWEPVLRWLFLGRTERESEFSELPVEVTYHMVAVLQLFF
jgi:hypothetical protein